MSGFYLNDPRAADSSTLSRRSLRHLLMRRRNERIRELRDERVPVVIVMGPETLDQLEIDGDPEEAWTLESATVAGEVYRFCSIPVLVDTQLEVGIFEVRWPSDEVPSDVPPVDVASVEAALSVPPPVVAVVPAGEPVVAVEGVTVPETAPPALPADPPVASDVTPPADAGGSGD